MGNPGCETKREANSYSQHENNDTDCYRPLSLSAGGEGKSYHSNGGDGGLKGEKKTNDRNQEKIK